MKIGRYVALLYGGTLLLTLSVLVIIVVAVTLVESAGKFSGDAGLGDAALSLALYSAVEYGYQVLPLACLLSALVAGTLLARRGEILAVQAAGLSPHRLWGAFFAVVLLATGVGTLMGEWAVPWAIAGTTRTELRRGDALSRFYTRESKWLRKDDMILYVPMVDSDQTSFLHPVIYRLAGSKITEVVDADSLTYEQGKWWLNNARVYALGGAQSSIKAVEVKRSLTLDAVPKDLVDVAADPRQIDSAGVRALMQRRMRAGFDVTAHVIELHDRRAFPLSAVWMFLLVAPWVFSPERRRSLAVNLGAGVVLIAVLLSLTQVWRMLALSHKIPVPLGAWGMWLTALVAIPCSVLLARRHRRRG